MAERPLGDRRSRVRYEVVGPLWGLLEVSETARIRNVSRTGALIETPFPAALASTHSLKLVVDGEHVDVSARVRHVRPVESEASGPASPGEGPRYLIGLEFISPPDSILRSVDHLGES
jgi:hypothetical protein